MLAHGSHDPPYLMMNLIETEWRNDMTKSKFFAASALGIAAAGAVVAGVLVKKRGKIKVEGQIDARGNGVGGLRRGKSLRGSASVGAHRRP